MFEIDHIIQVADRYAELVGAEEKTVSSRVFADSKKLGALRAGADITVGRFNSALRWFSEHWPVNADWPPTVPRPPQSIVPMEAAE